ncbi:putative protein N(5)-glutamine methyltransferase [Streptomyces mobaraensis NBRC 13819 = DSM 40847]|uniref:putative protein N(5)-glutamine methyltransferase n=1 Tax=Streptomyces mobaraensis TaxID=35621 RepID=UPI00034680E6|nr:putative protein N(5)-glutamine methyltransferase [Streptomyces mobaraensis]QTT75235.1 putative protein N(5)-glutamine methyltransferase [Streptomyces mobaraensis NBRC 13819 = DSM 40847]
MSIPSPLSSIPSLSSPSSLSSLSSVVTRLRAAGCVFAEEEAELLRSAASSAADSAAALDALVERRVSGVPLEHVVGWAEFAGLRVAVGPGVFVPRRRTEFLVERAVAAARPGAVVLDLCCGSGAVGAAVAAALGTVELHAADVEPAAVHYARRNLGPAARVYEGDLYAPLPAHLKGRVDVLVANAPYVPTGEIPLLPPEARDHEPLVTLDGGADGLDVQRRVAAEAVRWLAPGGLLLMETSERQAVRSMALFAASGLVPRLAVCDERNATVVTGTRPGRGRVRSSPGSLPNGRPVDDPVRIRSRHP